MPGSSTPQSILLIDNYDSFVHNLARYVEELGCAAVVRRNDRLTLDEIERLDPAGVIISPGPGTPDQTGICVPLIQQCSSLPILGVCLGHQAVAYALGAKVGRAKRPCHGQASLISHDQTGLFHELPNPLIAARYHSLIVEERGLPDCLSVTARTDDGTIMGLEHRERPVRGVQFHPESILTAAGHRMLANFLQIAGIEPAPVQFQEREQADDQDWYGRAIAWPPE